MIQDQKMINELWNRGSSNYNQIIHDELASFRVKRWQKKISEQIGNREGLKVLDCGCGPAFFTIILAWTGHQVIGIDTAEGMLQAARQNVAEYQADAEILEMDCHELDFPDNTFDLVVSRNVTHTLRDHPTVYREWLRVLKPDGVLLIFDANWHLPQASESMFLESQDRCRKCIELYGSDFSGNTVFDENAEFAVENKTPHPLGDLLRPDWDCGILQAVGFENITYDRNIIDELWDDKEKLIYGNTPMFMVRAVKS